MDLPKTEVCCILIAFVYMVLLRFLVGTCSWSASSVAASWVAGLFGSPVACEIGKIDGNAICHSWESCSHVMPILNGGCTITTHKRSTNCQCSKRQNEADGADPRALCRLKRHLAPLVLFEVCGRHSFQCYVECTWACGMQRWDVSRTYFEYVWWLMIVVFPGMYIYSVHTYSAIFCLYSIYICIYCR